jgi:hypothetical protein
MKDRYCTIIKISDVGTWPVVTNIYGKIYVEKKMKIVTDMCNMTVDPTLYTQMRNLFPSRVCRIYDLSCVSVDSSLSL